MDNLNINIVDPSRVFLMEYPTNKKSELKLTKKNYRFKN
jgi:hypothetical protein